MRAAVSRGRAEIGVDDVAPPEPGAGEVLVKIRACGLCGSDLHLYHSGFWAPGTTPGHEMTGVVERLGSGVEGWQPGDAVAVEPLVSCGTCPSCLAGRDGTCPESQIFGVHRAGGMAEYVSVPARRLFRVPSDLEPQLAALAEPMAVVVHGLHRGAFEPGQRVLVLGAGSIGLLTVAAARALGAGEVWLTARHAHQAKLGEDLGASRVLGEDETPAECADLVVETVGGEADTLRQAGAAVRRGGVVSVLGMFMGPVTLDAMPLLLKENTLAWSNCYLHPHEGADFETAVELVSAQRTALSALTSHGIPLDEVQRAFQIASDKSGGAIKVTILPEAS